MSGLPRLEQTRSLSRYGLSQVTVVFKEGTDIYFARQLVSERLQQAKSRLPDKAEPALGPIATGLGEIFYWTVEARPDASKRDGTPYSPADLREIQDWIVAPQLRGVAGVTEVNTIGGYLKEYQVAPDMAKLTAHGLSLATLVNAIDRNNVNAGAGYIERGGEQFVVRTPGQVKTLEEIRNIVLDVVDGAPVRVRDVADVEPGRELRTGAATENGREVVLGAVFMLVGQNSRAVADSARRKLDEVNRSLPPGIQALPVGAARHRDPVRVPGQPARGARHGAGHSAHDAARVHGHGAGGRQRQPDEPRRARLRHHHRRRRRHRRELHPPARDRTGGSRAAADAGGTAHGGGARGGGSAAAAAVRPGDHHDGLSAAARAVRHRRQDVPSDGADGRDGARGRDDPVGDVRAGRRRAVRQRPRGRARQPPDAQGARLVRAAAGLDLAQPPRRADVRCAVGAVDGPAGDAPRHGIRAEPGRRRPGRDDAAHPRHEPAAVGGDAAEAGSGPAARIPRDRARVRPHRHGRGGDGPDAAERGRQLPDPAPGKPMAAAAKNARATRGRDRGSGAPHPRQQLRVLAADPAALQRADLRRAQRRGRESLRRRHGDHAGDGPAHRPASRTAAGRGRSENRADRRLARADPRRRPHPGRTRRPERGGRAGSVRHARRRARRGHRVRGRPPLRHHRAPAGRGAQRRRHAAPPADLPARARRAQRQHPAVRDRHAVVRAGSEPDQPRERQAPHRRHGQRARARSRLVRRRPAIRPGQADVAGRRVAERRRPVREPAGGRRAPGPRRAGRAGARVRAAVPDVRQREGWAARVQRHPVRDDGRRAGAVAARAAAVDLRGRRLHRAVRRGRAERARDADVRALAARGRPHARAGDARGRAGALAGGADDGTRRVAGLFADGAGDEHGRRGAAAAGDRRHRRHPVVDGADPADPARVVHTLSSLIAYRSSLIAHLSSLISHLHLHRHGHRTDHSPGPAPQPGRATRARGPRARHRVSRPGRRRVRRPAVAAPAAAGRYGCVRRVRAGAARAARKPARGRRHVAARVRHRAAGRRQRSAAIDVPVRSVRPPGRAPSRPVGAHRHAPRHAGARAARRRHPCGRPAGRRGVELLPCVPGRDRADGAALCGQGRAVAIGHRVAALGWRRVVRSRGRRTAVCVRGGALGDLSVISKAKPAADLTVRRSGYLQQLSDIRKSMRQSWSAHENRSISSRAADGWKALAVIARNIFHQRLTDLVVVPHQQPDHHRGNSSRIKRLRWEPLLKTDSAASAAISAPFPLIVIPRSACRVKHRNKFGSRPCSRKGMMPGEGAAGLLLAGPRYSRQAPLLRLANELPGRRIAALVRPVD
ncbi:hypothetical protein Lal_00014763 [Lupinus albus]|nr:hypothetical protein Lal_00014763 [Lupinus albus]